MTSKRARPTCRKGVEIRLSPHFRNALHPRSSTRKTGWFRIRREEEGEEREAPARRHRQCFMDQRTGEQHGTAARRLVALLPIFRENQLAALIFLAIEIERHGEHAIAGARALAVAMAAEIVAPPGVITDDLEVLEAKSRGEMKGLGHLRRDTPADRRCQDLGQVVLADDMVAPLF